MQKSNPSLLDSEIDDDERRDPIDAIVPAPAPWWRRLVVGVVVVGAVTAISFLWGLGYLRPAPDCCGSGNGTSFMSLSTDGQAVTTTAYFFNSSGRDLTISSASAVLPGAEVLGVAMLHPDNDRYPTDDVVDYPLTIAGHHDAQVLITFRPESCVVGPGETNPWGTVTLELDVANSRLPSFGRSHDIDVVSDQNGLLVLPPSDVENLPSTPLAAACALLAQ